MQLEKETIYSSDISYSLLFQVIESCSIGVTGLKPIKIEKREIIDFEFITINNIASEILGKTAGEIIGKRLSEILPETSESKVLEYGKQCLEFGKKQEIEYIIQYRKTQKRLKLIFFNCNDGIVISLQNIDLKRIPEEKQEEENTLVKQITECSPDPIYICDLKKHTSIYFNPSVLLLTGYSEEELSGMGKNLPSIIIHPGDFQKAMHYFASFKNVKDDEIKEIEYRIITKSGSIRHLLSKNRVFKRNKSGIPSQIIGSSRDITEMRNAEMLALNILKSSLNGIVVFKTVRDQDNLPVDFNWHLINEAATGFLMDSGATLLGRSFRNNIPPVLNHISFEDILTVIETGNSFKSEKYLDFEEMENWIAIEIVKLDDGAMVTFNDITERKRVEQILRVRNSQLSEAYREVDSSQRELKLINEELEKHVKDRNSELVLSEKRYRSLALATSSIVWVINGVGEMEIENQLWQNYTGQDFNHYKKFGWLKMIHPEDRREQRNLWSHAFSHKQTIDTEFRLKNSKEQYRYMQVRVVPILDNDGGLMEWIGTCTEIHDKKMAEASLKESEERYEIATKATHDAIWDWNLLTNSLTYTENYYSIFGDTDNRGAAIEDWFKNIHPEDNERVVNSVYSVLNTGKNTWEEEYCHKKQDGTHVFVYNRAYVIHDETGKPVRMVGAMVDITQRKKAEEKLKESEANLKEAQRISKIGNWSWELGSNELCWSEEMYNIYEIASDETPNILKLKTFHVDNTLLSEKISNAINYGTAFQMDAPILLGNGETKYVQTIGKAEMDENGSCIRIFGTSMDITDRKHTEERLEQLLKETQIANQKLIKMNEVLDNFVYAAAHDLRSPVANLRLILSLLDNTEDISKVKRHLKDFNTSINRLDNTIKGLVEVIEIQSNQENLGKELSFCEIIETIQEELKHEIEQKKATINVEVSACPSINYIEAYLFSIIRNLMSNSLKYSRNDVDPVISIYADREGEFVKLIIEDNGIGMDLDKYGKNLFKPFTRFTKHIEGKGLGLHLIKNIIEKNDGKIKVTSHPQQGSVFVNYLKEYSLM